MPRCEGDNSGSRQSRRGPILQQWRDCDTPTCSCAWKVSFCHLVNQDPEKRVFTPVYEALVGYFAVPRRWWQECSRRGLEGLACSPSRRSIPEGQGTSPCRGTPGRRHASRVRGGDGQTHRGLETASRRPGRSQTPNGYKSVVPCHQGRVRRHKLSLHRRSQPRRVTRTCLTSLGSQLRLKCASYMTQVPEIGAYTLNSGVFRCIS